METNEKTNDVKTTEKYWDFDCEVTWLPKTSPVKVHMPKSILDMRPKGQTKCKCYTIKEYYENFVVPAC